MAPKIEKIKVTVYLIKEKFKKTSDFLKTKGTQKAEINNSDGNELGTLYYKSGFPATPKWAKLFDGLGGFSSEGVKNKYSLGVFVTKVNNRFLCFTFGHSRHLIESFSTVRNFGLLVSLNLADPKALKSIDKTKLGRTSINSKEQSTKNIELLNFDFDAQSDLLKSITAYIDSGNEKKEIISGRDSVSISMDFDIVKFHALSDKLLTEYGKQTYKESFPNIDKIVAERDPYIVQQLDEEIVQNLKQKDFSKTWLAIPEVVIWKQVHGFSWRNVEYDPKKPGAIILDDLLIEDWVNKGIRDLNKLKINSLTTKKVFLYDVNNTVIDSWSIYRCLNAEVDYENEKYILNDGSWYRISSDFVSEVNNYFHSIKKSKLELPNFGTRNEPDYLEYVSTVDNTFFCMDRKLVQIGGNRSSFEFCDLFSKGKQIIHVKKYGGSKVLSHLFNQALVSGKIFLEHQKSRVAINQYLPPSFRFINAEAPIVTNDYEICIAIMSVKEGELEIPFFSKVSLKNVVQPLTYMGYKVTKLKIER